MRTEVSAFEQAKFAPTNELMTDAGILNPEKTGEYIFGELKLPKNLNNITLQVCACFSAGTVSQLEKKELTPLNTFAGELHASMRDSMGRLFCVVGYVGQGKPNMAGFPVESDVKPARASRSTGNLNDNELWSIGFISAEQNIYNTGELCPTIYEIKTLTSSPDYHLNCIAYVLLRN